MIKWNDKVKLIISDVDETIADLYKAAEPEMINELASLLKEGKVLFFISGQSVQSINWRIVNYLPKELRQRLLVGHCSGCEVWGYSEGGELNDKPYYSHYEGRLNLEQRILWRKIVDQIVSKFGLIRYDTMTVELFKKKAGNNPLAIMYEDRGPQITFEMINSYELSGSTKEKLNKAYCFDSADFRDAILKEAEILLNKHNIPITARKAGVFAIDFAIKGISKTTAVRYIVENDELMKKFGVNPENVEELLVLGDKFSLNGGTDRHISEALDPKVLSITFRKENPAELPKGYNIQIWNGSRELHEGTLEFLKLRKKR